MTKATRILMSGTMVWVLAICLLPATGSAATAFNFTFSSAGSSATVSQGFLTSLTENISAITINGVSYTGLNDTLTVTSTAAADNFAFSGALSGALTGVNGTWLDFEIQPSTATQNGAGDFVVVYGSAASLDNVSSVLALDLGATFTTGIGELSIGAGSGALINSQGVVTSDVLSATLFSVTIGTPEPSAFLLLGMGLLVICAVARTTICSSTRTH